MTKRSLLTTASVAVLALAIASPAFAGANDFANLGSGTVKIYNNNNGGDGNGGAGGTATDADTDENPEGGLGGLGGTGGAGGVGEELLDSGNSPGVVNDVAANSGNTYKRTEYNVYAVNNQNADKRKYGMPDGCTTCEQTEYGDQYINTYGGYNYQYGGDASSDADTTAYADNYNETYINGGTVTGGLALSVNAAASVAVGGDVKTDPAATDGDADGDASAHADNNTPVLQLGTLAESGDTTGGNGGVGAEILDSGSAPGSTNLNLTMSQNALDEANGGNTGGTQDANGGDVSSGGATVDSLNNAAGALAMNGASGAFGVGNSANAVAARVNSIVTN